MSSCNLAEMVYNKWLQQSSNRGTDLYVAIINNFVWALIQVVRYYQYLKDEHADVGPGKEELFLRAAQHLAKRSEDPKVLSIGMTKLLRTDLLCTREPHLVGKGVFGSQMRKADITLGFEGKSYLQDKMNFSRLQIATMFAKADHASCSLADVAEELSPDLQEDHVLNNLGQQSRYGDLLM
jgi:hypothetical protein